MFVTLLNMKKIIMQGEIYSKYHSGGLPAEWKQKLEQKTKNVQFSITKKR
jgi:hypothetical protein